jgi:IS30 family transposase
MGFRGRGQQAPESVREAFFEAVNAGLSWSAAATAAGVYRETGAMWARAAGYEVQTKHFGTRYSVAAREAFWAVLKGGASVTQAAVDAGVSESAATRWVRKAGYVPRTAVSTATGSAIPPVAELATARRSVLTFTERCRLEELLENGCAPARVAELMARHRDTIGREIARGQTGSGYRAGVGQDVADANRKRPKERKLVKNPALLAVVLEGLASRDSPEQISGRLHLDFPDNPEMQVSHETIYQAIYVQPRGELAKDLKSALRTGRIKRKPQGRSEIAEHRRFKDGMVSITERPAEADDRAVPGHWEGDLILGAGNTSAIGTLVERTTGFVVLLHLPGDHTAETVSAAIMAKIPEIPEILLRSLTWDQGTEMAKHATITEATGLPIYFCDPHSPWQRATNENTNGLLRQYFPKGTDLGFWGPGFLDQVAAELNARPRKRHGFHTPAEELDRLLSDPSTYAAATA